MAHPDQTEKTCRSCGRRIVWRKKWERDWDQVRYCSQACRRRGLSVEDQRIEEDIRASLAPPVTAVALDDIVWTDRNLTVQGSGEATRRAARRLVAAGEIVLVQHGRVVDPSTSKGPLSVRRR